MRISILAGLAVGAFALTAGASQAQGYYGWYHPQPTYSQPGGDFYSGRYGFGGYPEFRGIEQHIRSELQQAVRDETIPGDDARALFGQLRRIQDRERREYRVHGWGLPQDDRASIRADLGRLDHLVDETRDLG